MKKSVHNKKDLEPFRKSLRSNLTPAEACLWERLQNQNFEGRKFRRQHSIKNYIVDFYCPGERLIIELDGQVHLNPLAETQDYERDQILKSMGFTVLRFENKLVFENLELVLAEIKENFRR